MGFLFPSFDGPQRTSPYVLAPRRRRAWPIAAAFGAGIGCVLVLLGPWRHAERGAGPAPAADEQTANTVEMPVEATRAEPTPQDAPAKASQAGEKSASAKASEAKPREIKGPNSKASKSKASATKGASAAPVPAAEPAVPGARDQTASARITGGQ